MRNIILRMNKKTVLILRQFNYLYIFLFLSSVGIQAQEAQDAEVPGKIRLKFTEEMAATFESTPQQKSTSGFITVGTASLNNTHAQFKATNYKRVYPDGGKFEEKHRKYGLHLWYEIDIDKEMDVKNACGTYETMEGVQLAEPIYLKKIEGSLTSTKKTSQNMTLIGSPNDTNYDRQWHYNNTGQTGGTPGADIDLERAWEIETGSSDVIVAIIDNGVDYAHEDLVDAMWMNENEIADNGIDDDNNGYVDDIYGYNFADRTGEISISGHGTHVAGTVGATTNNEIGVAGVAGGDGSGNGVRLMSAQMLSANAEGGFGEAFIYAADHGAVIAQNSWGYIYPGFYQQSTLDGINYFIAEAGYDALGNPRGPMQGGVVIFASGNNQSFEKYYPAAHEAVIAVSATDHLDNPATFSNKGDWVELAAPGVNVLSSFDGFYNFLEGTSMACPHVSGVAALIVSKYAGNITPEEVWSRLIGGTDPLPYDFFGSGRLNAFNSLQDNSNIAPDPITDVTVTDIDQNTLSFSWTAPKDQDNIDAFRYEIRYATEPITEANYDTAIRADGQYLASEAGSLENFSIIVPPSTNYYVAIKSFDYFNNISGISNVVTAMSTSAPLIEVTPDELIAMNIDVSVNPLGSSNLTINNLGDDILDYKATAYVGFMNLVYPGAIASLNQSNTDTAQGNASTIGLENLKLEKSLANEQNQLTTRDSIYYDSGSEEITNFTGAPSGSISNAFAVKFEVNQPTFELTHIRNAIQVVIADDDITEEPPVVIEIYKGPTLGNSELLTSQEVIPTVKFGFSTFPILIPQSFVEGDVFWIVQKFASYSITPQGIDEGVADANRFFHSTDGGNTYTSDEFIYKTRALSATNNGETLVLDTNTDSLDANATKEVLATFDASSIADGTYDYSVAINSNDPQKPAITVPFQITVSGQLPTIVPHTEILQFNNLFVGEEDTKQLIINNTGLGDLQINNIASTVSEFAVANEEIVIKSGESYTIDVTFTPSTLGATNGVLNLSTNDPNKGELTIQLIGVSIDPPVIAVTPDSITTTATSGDLVTEKITISNTGNYPLNYSFPEIGANGNSNTSGNDEDFGYTWIDSNEPGGPVYVWNDIQNTGIEILEGEDDDQFELELPFVFSFYGEEYTDIFLNTNGLVTFNSNRANRAFPIPSTESAGINNFIAAYQSDLVLNEGVGSMFYKVTDDKLIVQYEQINSADGAGTASFQIILNKRGNIFFYYKDMSSLEIQDDNISIGIENNDGTQGIEIAHNTPYVEDELAVMITHPVDFITEVSSISGIVGVGASTEIDVTLDTSSLLEGSYQNELLVSSNDPENSIVIAPITLTVLGTQGIPTLTSNSLEFGELFIGKNGKLSLNIKNPGSKAFTIEKIENTSSEFIIDFDAPLLINGDDSLEVQVVFTPVGTNLLTDTITITTDVVGSEELSVAVSGTGIFPPILSTSSDSFVVEANNGEKVLDTLTIQNTGAFPLEYSINAPSWSKIDKNEQENEEIITVSSDTDEEYGYIWASSEEPGGATFNFIDISQTGIDITEETFTNSHKNLPINFDFSFYGNSYTDVWLSSSGLLYFAEEPLEIRSRNRLPREDDTNNLIAGLWENIYQDAASAIHYQSSEEYFIVQFTDVVINSGDNLILTDTATFQMILYPNGNIKFQYGAIEEENQSTFYSYAGIENETGTDGFMTAFNNDISSNTAVLIEAPHTGVIMPGEEAILPITFDATHLSKENYLEELIITSNDPLQNKVSIPLDFTVFGEAVIISELDLIDFEEIIIQEGDIATATKTITIENTGGDELVIEAIETSDPTFTTSFSRTITVDPKETETIDITFTSDTGNISSVSGDLIITSNALGNETLTIPMIAEVVDSPVFFAVTENDTIHTTVRKNGSYNSLVTLENNAVSGTLIYDDEVSYLQIDDVFIANQNVSALKSGLKEVNYSIQDSLYYQTSNDTSGFISLDNEQFTSAVKFVVGEKENFELTHIQNSYSTNQAPITINIYRGGNLPNEGELLMSQQHSPQGAEGFELIPLDTPQLIRAGETFWITIEYPLDNTNENSYGQGVFSSQITDYNYNVYYYSLNAGKTWTSSERTFERLAYQIKALGSKYVDWLTVNSNQNNLAAGTSTDINVQLDATGMEAGTYYANINFTSNDVTNPLSSIPVRMTVNDVPEFYSTPTDTLQVMENETLEVVLQARDSDGSITSYALNENYDNVSFEFSPEMAKLTFSPDLTQSGFYTFTVDAHDDFDDIGSTSFVVEVIDVNRAPFIVQEIPKQEFSNRGGRVKSIDLSRYIQDLDMDGLSYTIVVTDPSLIDFTVEDNILTGEPLGRGRTFVSIIASDGKGGQVGTSFNVLATSTTTIANKSLTDAFSAENTGFFKMNNYPNPFQDETNISYQIDIAGHVNVSVFTVNGKFIKTLVDQHKEIGNYDILFGRNSMSSGHYLYVLTINGRPVPAKIMIIE